MNTRTLARDKAELVAISALQHLAGDEDLLMRFCAVTGLLANELRTASSDPGFLTGVLDFFLAHEPDLLAWTEAAGHDPQIVVAARHALSPDEEWST